MSGQKHSEELEEISLYAEHEKIYPRQAHGMFAILRVIGVSKLLLSTKIKNPYYKQILVKN
jgi:hypothetical protein